MQQRHQNAKTPTEKITKCKGVLQINVEHECIEVTTAKQQVAVMIIDMDTHPQTKLHLVLTKSFTMLPNLIYNDEHYLPFRLTH